MGLRRKNVSQKRQPKQVDLMVEMMSLMKAMMVQSAEHSRMQQEWLKLFKPPEQRVKSTTAEERESMKVHEELWTELDMNEMMKNMMPSSSDDTGDTM